MALDRDFANYALLDDAINGQMARYPYGPLPLSNQVLELPPAGQQVLEIPQAVRRLPPMPPYVLRPAPSLPAGVPRAGQEALVSGQIMNSIMRLANAPGEAVAYGSEKAGLPPAVGSVLSAILPLLLFGLGSRMLGGAGAAEEGAGAGALTGETAAGAETGSLMRPASPFQQVPGRTVPMGPQYGTSELELGGPGGAGGTGPF